LLVLVPALELIPEIVVPIAASLELRSLPNVVAPTIATNAMTPTKIAYSTIVAPVTSLENDLARVRTDFLM
jgi:hypothetical protein